AKPTLEMFLEYCIPKKADDPETPKYLELAKIVLDSDPAFVNQPDELGETALFKAAERGSLPHVKFFIENGAIVDQPNNLGNTALWVACAKRYPCIIEE